MKKINKNIILAYSKFYGFLISMTKKENITLVLSLIGALAWSPFIYEVLQKPQLEAKLLGLAWSQDYQFNAFDPFTNSNNTLQGIGYFPKIAIVSLKKNFNIKNVEVFIKYPGEWELRKGEIFYAPQINMTFVGEGKARILKIPPSEHISALLVLENGKPVSVFVPFAISKPVYENFEFLELRFYEFDGTIETIKFDKKDIDVKSIFFEEKYWE